MTTYDYDLPQADVGSDFVDGERFAGYEGYGGGYLYDEDHPQSRRYAEEWAAVRRGPTGRRTTGAAMVGVFFRTYGVVILGTVVCAMIVCPLLLPFMVIGGVVVGVAVGLVMAIINTAVTAWAFHPPSSKAAYRTYTRGLLSGLVVATIGIGCVALVGTLIRDLAIGTTETPGIYVLHLVEGVAYSIYAMVGCLLVARWTGALLADQVIRVQWPELDIPLPTRRQLRHHPERGGLPWG